MSRSQRRAMIDREEPKLSLVRQCALLGISRSSLYYLPTEAGTEDLELMALIDQQYLKTPFYDSRRMTAWLRNHGHRVNRKRVRRLMQLIGLEAIYRRPNTSKPNPGHKVYPYLLRGLEINRVNQVWATDITYIPMARGFLYLMAIMDWHSRYVLAWRLSNTLEVDFCVAALEEALSKGRPQIFNTDQGSQFTSEAFTSMLLAQGVQVSMDGRGRCMDNVFVERLWRSIKYEEVYLKAYQNGTEARKGIGAYLAFYNQERPHQALGLGICSSIVPTRVSHARDRYPLRWVTRSALRSPYSAPVLDDTSASMIPSTSTLSASRRKSTSPSIPPLRNSSSRSILLASPVEFHNVFPGEIPGVGQRRRHPDPRRFLGLFHHWGQASGIIGFIHHVHSGDQHAGYSLIVRQRRDHGLGVVAGHNSLTGPHQPGICIGQIDAIWTLIALGTLPARQIVHRLPHPLSQRLLVG